jgi:ubiquinol-cytochrome c reductase iron-sulfur subunit
MAPLATASRLALRSAASVKTPAVRALSSTAVRGGDASASSSYTSPFKGTEQKGNKIPDFGKYMRGSEGPNKVFQYFMVGTMGALTAAGAKSTVQGGCYP